MHPARALVWFKRDLRHQDHALHGFAGRLRWHSHFMQKPEDEPEIEFRNFARVCDGLRKDHFDEALFDAWCAGRTGYPMVDAGMMAPFARFSMASAPTRPSRTRAAISSLSLSA